MFNSVERMQGACSGFISDVPCRWCSQIIRLEKERCILIINNIGLADQRFFIENSFCERISMCMLFLLLAYIFA